MSLSSGDTSQAARHRHDFLAGLGILSRDLVCAEQVHDARVQVVVEADRGRGALQPGTAFPGTDALVTRERLLPLAVFTADCLPVMLFEPGVQCLAVVHAGWRSTRQGILGQTIRVMGAECGASPERIRAAFGPSIRSCCYEVGREFKETFPSWIEQRGSRLFFDLAEAAAAQLMSAGVQREHLRDAGVCTCCHTQEFFSFRAEGRTTGRMMSVMMRR